MSAFNLNNTGNTGAPSIFGGGGGGSAFGAAATPAAGSTGGNIFGNASGTTGGSAFGCEIPSLLSLSSSSQNWMKRQHLPARVPSGEACWAPPRRAARLGLQVATSLAMLPQARRLQLHHLPETCSEAQRLLQRRGTYSGTLHPTRQHRLLAEDCSGASPRQEVSSVEEHQRRPLPPRHLREGYSGAGPAPRLLHKLAVDCLATLRTLLLPQPLREDCLEMRLRQLPRHRRVGSSAARRPAQAPPPLQQTCLEGLRAVLQLRIRHLLRGVCSAPSPLRRLPRTVRKFPQRTNPKHKLTWPFSFRRCR
jgi:hypothetical protein